MGGRFGANAEELAVLGETTVGGIENQVEFVDAGGNRLGPEFGERAEEGFRVADVKFDFDFGRHGVKKEDNRE